MGKVAARVSGDEVAGVLVVVAVVVGDKGSRLWSTALVRLAFVWRFMIEACSTRKLFISTQEGRGQEASARPPPASIASSA